MEDKSELTLKLTALDYLAARVDTVFQSHLALIDVVGVRVASNLVAQHEHVADGPDKTICVLLLNAMSSLMAALELARRGFPIQVGILVRNSIEVMAVAAVINSDGQASEKYRQGRLDSPSCIGIVKKTWPEVGSVLAKAWGNLSNDFTHVGNLYKRWQTVSPVPTYGELFALGTVLLAIMGKNKGVRPLKFYPATSLKRLFQTGKRPVGKTKVSGTIIRTDDWGFGQLMVPDTFIHPGPIWLKLGRKRCRSLLRVFCPLHLVCWPLL